MKKEINAEDIPEHSFKNPVRGKYAQRAKSEGSKVRITMYLDMDIYNYFQKRAERANAAGYQTQINEELRLAMERDKTGKSAFSDLINNREFIAAVAAEVRREIRD